MTKQIKYIAKPNTWFKAGTEVTLVDDYRPESEDWNAGLFEGIRVCTDNSNEKRLGYKPGDERVDQEVCPFEEFHEVKVHNNYCKVGNVPAEFLMEYFNWTVNQAGGDGAAAIFCSNPEETYEFYLRWWKKNKLPSMKARGYKLDTHPNKKDIYYADNGGLVVNLHDCNENHMFCDKVFEMTFDGDVGFIVEEDCPSFDNSFCIRRVKSEL